MGAEEGAAGSGDGATEAAEHLRWYNLGSSTALDCRSVARYVQLSERRFRVVQPDGGPPRREIYASSRPQGRVFHGRLLERLATMASQVSGSDRPPGQANRGDDHDRKYHLQSAGRRQGGRLGHRLPGYGAIAGKGSWEIQTHPHLPVPIPPLRGPGFADRGRRAGLQDGQGDGRIPDHSGSGFVARNGRRRACSSAIASIGTLADAQLEEEIDLQGAIRISSSLVQGTVKAGSTGNSAEDATTGFSTGRRAGMGGETLRRRSEEPPTGLDSIRIHGGGAGADWFQARDET